MSQSNNFLLGRLESRIDHLEAELGYLHNLLVAVGFSEGISTLKETAEELLREQAEAQ
jgi:hypothetical protein